MQRFSLSIKLILAVTVAAGLTLVLLGVAALRILDSLVLEAEMDHARLQSRLLVPVIQGLAHTPDDLNRTLTAAADQGGRSDFQIEVLNPDMETLFPAGIRPAAARLGFDRLQELADREPERRVEPIQLPGRGRRLVGLAELPGQGWLLVSWDLVHLDQKRATLGWVLVLIGGVAWLLVSILGYILVRRWFLHPIRQVFRLAERVSTGQEARPAVEALLSREDEVGFMGRTLREMARRIATDREKITSQVDELKEMNRQLQVAHDRLVRSETLASVGRLAAGVAHEIGNPVGIILGYLEILDEDVSDPEARTAFEHIRNATQRIDSTIRDMLDFSRPAIDEEATCDPAVASREILGLVEPQKRFRHVKARVEAGPEPLVAAMPPSRFKQVLLNLLLNAADAMEGQAGHVMIRLEAAQDGGVNALVKDDGPGIPADTLDKVFDPFYTTKDPGQGTGLGLFMAHQILQRYKGGISVKSREGEGTTFILELPPPNNGADDA